MPAQPDKYDELILLLEQAVTLLGKLEGGYSDRFSSAKVFREELQNVISAFRLGKRDEIYRLYGWFAPTGDWDDFTGVDGLQPGNEIFDLITQIVKYDEVRNKPVQQQPHSLWGWIKAIFSEWPDSTPP